MQTRRSRDTLEPMTHPTGELEVHMKPESGKAVIEGKTVVPFQSFVTLVLQRKVLSMFKVWGKHPVIIDSELLTSMASAPQDSQDNRSNVVLVSLVVGIVTGVAAFAIVQMLLLFGNIQLQMRELGLITISIVGVVALLIIVIKLQKKPKSEKLIEAVESLSSFLR